MVDSFIRVPPNSTGEKVRVFRNTVGSDDVSSEAMTIVDKDGNVQSNLINGRLAVTMADEAGTDVLVTPLSELTVVQKTRIINDIFSAAAIDTQTWTITTATGGTTAITGGEAVLAVTSSNGSSSNIVSKTIGRFISGTSNLYHAVLRMDAGVTNNVRRWGAFTSSAGVPQDGYYYRLDGTTLS